MTHEIAIKIRSGIGEVVMASVAIKALCLHFSMPAMVAYKIELCVTEMLNNINEHGFKFEEGHSIKLNLSIDDQKLVIGIVYHAEPIPKMIVTSPNPDGPAVAQLSERGYGWFLVDEIMDDVSYENQEGQNRLTMIKYRAEENEESP